jgi:dihydroorotate dehydrogenase electron transfer subunit
VPFDVDAEIVANIRLAPDYNIVSLAAPEIASITEPGQFVMIKPSRDGDPLLRRPFSVFERVGDSRGTITGLTILNKRVGRGTRLLYSIEPGARLACLGPLGRPFTAANPPPGEAWMIAGGVGLAPFATLAETLQTQATPMRLYYGAKTGEELFSLSLFESLGCRLVLATEDGSRGDRGLVTRPLERDLADAPRNLVLYACGPTPMMKAVARLAAAAGRELQVSLEPTMGCGLGGCYSCVVPTKVPGGKPHYVRGCLDGPVFDSGRLAWEML